MLISKSYKCPYRHTPHQNLAYAIYSNGAWCYSCNKGTIKERPFIKEFASPSTIDGLKLPEEATTNIKEFPTHILAWFYQYFVYNNDILKHGIMYVPYQEFTTKNGVSYYGESIILPLLCDARIAGYQRRFFPTKMFFSFGLQHIIGEFGCFTTNTLVIVEDYISALRVGGIENCLWLQGTNLTKKTLSYIMQNYAILKIWLDGDEPGQRAANGIINKINSFMQWEGINRAFAIREVRTIKNIITELDPKCYSNEEIKEILNV